MTGLLNGVCVFRRIAIDGPVRAGVFPDGRREGDRRLGIELWSQPGGIAQIPVTDDEPGFRFLLLLLL